MVEVDDRPSYPGRREVLGAVATATVAGCLDLTGGGTTSGGSGNREVSGSLVGPGGDSLGGVTVDAWPVNGSLDRWRETDVTGPDGGFSMELPRRKFVLCVFQVTDEDPDTARIETGPDGVVYPRDGVPDVYGFAQLGASDTGTGETELPEGRLLEVTVQDPSGEPVPEARVSVMQDLQITRTGLVGIRTDALGRAVVSPDGPGVEVRGRIHVGVRPPPGSDRFSSGVVDRTLTVDRDRSVSVELDGG